MVTRIVLDLTYQCAMCLLRSCLVAFFARINLAPATLTSLAYKSGHMEDGIRHLQFCRKSHEIPQTVYDIDATRKIGALTEEFDSHDP